MRRPITAEEISALVKAATTQCRWCTAPLATSGPFAGRHLWGWRMCQNYVDPYKAEVEDTDAPAT